MKARVLYVPLAVAMVVTMLYAARAGGEQQPWRLAKPHGNPWTLKNPWIRRWSVADRDIHAALWQASRLFGVSYDWLHDCVHHEGGHVALWKLRRALRHGTQPGWNIHGSDAFGPLQFMLDRKPAPSPWDWGTFGAYDDAAFQWTRDHGKAVPMRFKRPDSNVGQAVVGAYMFGSGEAHQWQGAGC